MKQDTMLRDVRKQVVLEPSKFERLEWEMVDDSVEEGRLSESVEMTVITVIDGQIVATDHGVIHVVMDKIIRTVNYNNDPLKDQEVQEQCRDR